MPDPLKINRDYTIDTAGRCIFTKEFLLSRGECCGSGCRNCPYSSPVIKNTTEQVERQSRIEDTG